MWWEPTNGNLSLYEYRLSGGDTQRWWGDSNPTCCNQICLRFLHLEVVGMQKHLSCTIFEMVIGQFASIPRKKVPCNLHKEQKKNRKGQPMLSRIILEHIFAGKSFTWKIEVLSDSVMLLYQQFLSKLWICWTVFLGRYKWSFSWGVRQGCGYRYDKSTL